jgi:hypothetical protein
VAAAPVSVQAYLPAIRDHVQRAAAGLDALGALLARPVAAASPALPNEGEIYAAVRAMLGGRLSPANFDLLKAAIARAMKPAPASPIGLTESDFRWAAAELGCSYATIRAVDEVESSGGGFEPARAAVLALDGEGGFLSSEFLPKILFEAHKFARHTDGRFNTNHPDISSARWNRALYKGGQDEYGRLHRAMQLDQSAALKSASVGRYQILGENHRLAGFGTVQAFWDAMMASERRHLEAFVAFVKGAGLVDELRRISGDPGDCDDFAAGYNGPAYEAHGYHRRLAAAHAKWSRQ